MDPVFDESSSSIPAPVSSPPTGTGLTLSALQSSADFQNLSPQVQQQAIKGYFTDKEVNAKTEDELNEYFKERMEYLKGNFQKEYQSKFPEDTQADVAKVEQTPSLYQKSLEIARMHNDLAFNTQEAPKHAQVYKAEGVEDQNRKLVIKPFTNNGQNAYSVQYPNGDTEAVPIDNMPQLMQFFRDQRRDKFDGKFAKKGFFDASFAPDTKVEGVNTPLANDDELDLILDKINNTTGGAQGAVINPMRQTISNISQGFDTRDIEDINNKLNKHRTAQQTIEALTPEVKELERKKAEFPNFAGEERLQDLRHQLEAAQDIVSNKGVSLIGKMALDSVDEQVKERIQPQSDIDNLGPVIARLEKKKDQFRDRFDLADEQALREAKESYAKAQQFLKDNPVSTKTARRIDRVNPLGTEVAFSEEQAEPQLTQAYKDLADEMADSQGIAGSRVTARLDNYIANKARERMEKTGKDDVKNYSYASYFTENPQDIMPYLVSTTASALPDMGMIFGASALANMAGGPGAAATTAQQIGFAREYSASLLTEIQLRAAKEGKALTDRNAIEGYLNDPVFMERTKAKAATRASVIGLSEAVLGGLAGTIANNVSGTFKKIASTVGIGALTEAAGEYGAIGLTEGFDKMDWRAVAEESIGSLGLGVVSAATIPAQERAEAAKLNIEKLKAQARLAQSKVELPSVAGTLSSNPDSVPQDIVDQETLGSAKYQDRVTTPSLSETVDAPPVTPTAEDSLLTEDLKQQDDAINSTDTANPSAPTPVVPSDSNAPSNGDTAGGVTTEDTPINTKNLTSRVRDMVRRFLVGFNQATGSNTATAEDPALSNVDPNDPTEIARTLLSNPLYRGAFDIISDQSEGSYDRIMDQLKNSGLDTESAGRLMGAVGLTKADAPKTVFTNLTDDFWLRNENKRRLDPNNEPVSDYERKGMIMSAALDEMVKRLSNVRNINEIPFSETEKMSPNNAIGLQLTEDGIAYDEETKSYYGYSSKEYPGMDSRESRRRFAAFGRTKQALITPLGDVVQDKFAEAKQMNRPGIVLTDLGTDEFKGKTAKEIAETLESKYKGKYVIKSRVGSQGSDIYHSVWNDGSPRGVEEMTKAVQAAMDNEQGGGKGSLSDAYVESRIEYADDVKPDAKGDKKHKEYRVHAVVLPDGTVEAFSNGTYDREQFQDQIDQSQQEGSKEQVMFPIPVGPYNPVVEALHKAVREQGPGMKLKPGIYGFDMALGQQNGKVQPVIFELNPFDMTGLSGFAGRNLVMQEMISELTPGRPSPLAGLYQIAKTGLSKEDLNAISTAVKQRIKDGFKDSPLGDKAVRTGMHIYTPYSNYGKWMQAMKNQFNAPVRFLKQLYNGIRAVFGKTVDPIFEQQVQEAYAPTTEAKSEAAPESAPESITKAKKPTTSLPSRTPSLPVSTLQPTGKGSNAGGKTKQFVSLRDYIQKLLPNPLLTESQKQILDFISNSANENFLDNVKVKKAEKSDTGSSYFMDNSTIYIHKNATAQEVVEEVIHAVTADFVAYNSHAVQDALGYDSNNRNNTTEMKGFIELVNPDNKQFFVDKGVSEDFIDSVTVYMGLLGELGFTQDQFAVEGTFPLGSDASSYAYQAENSDKIPYGAVSLSEMMAQAISNKKFQKQLSGMASVLSNAKNLFNELIRIIARTLGIPINKDNLLFDAVSSTEKAISSKDNYFFADLSGINNGDTNAALNSERVKPVNIVNIDGADFQENEVSQETIRMAARAQSKAELETIRKKAEEEKQERRFTELKNLYKTVLKGMEYKGLSSLREAREKVVDAMHKQTKMAAQDYADATNQKVEDIKKPSKARKQHAAILVENQVLAVQYFDTFRQDPLIPNNHIKFVGDALSYILKQTAEPMNLTTAEMKYYNNVLMSLSDGGPPTGFKNVLVDMNNALNVQRAAFTNTAVGAGSNSSVNRMVQWASAFLNFKPVDHFRKGIGTWRGEPFLGIAQGELGSTASFASELNYMGVTTQARDFLGKLTGIYRDNINLQQLEEDTQVAAFYDHLKTQFPSIKGTSIQPINKHRIGLVARLTQYNAAKPDPLGQLISRYDQLVTSIPVMSSFDTTKAGLATRALTEIVGTADMRTMPDENAFIAHLERGLTPAEKAVLDNMRQVGQHYLPALMSVKALTRSSVLDQYVNYVHDSNITPSERGERDTLKATTSQSDVLMDREGINPLGRGTYPDLDSINIADRQIRSSTYEKYTGVERHLLTQTLADSSPIPAILDRNTDASKPITQRLRKIIDVAHNAKTGTQPSSGPFIATVEGMVNIVRTGLVSGLGAAVKNFVSSGVQRAGLLSLDRDALKDAFIYELYPVQIERWMSNFPTEKKRAGEYDTLRAKDTKSNTWNKFKSSFQAREGVITAAFKSFPYAGQDAIQLIQRTVMDNLSKLSNAIPERHNARAMFVAAYLHYAKKNGTATDAMDFLARLPVDQNAATMASDFVSRSLGYAPDKMNKGSFWNGSTATKKLISNLFFVFRQQSNGIGIQFQNEMVNATQNFRAGNFNEAKKSAAMAATLLANQISFRALSMAFGSYMAMSNLNVFFNADDEEEKKRQLLRVKDKNAQASKTNNTRDLVTETAMTVVPVTTSALAFEMISAWGLDVGKTTLDMNAQGIEVENKDDMRDEVIALEAQIKEMNELVRQRDKVGKSSLDLEEQLDKLEVEKQELSDKIKFRYFPNKPLKAAMIGFGATGIAAEAFATRIENFVSDDLDDPDKKALQDIMNTEFAYKDTLAGSTFPWDYLRNAGQYVQNFAQFEKRPENRVPVELFWKSMIKLGQNPAMMVERGRIQMAKDFLTEERRTLRMVNRLRAKVGKDPVPMR